MAVATQVAFDSLISVWISIVCTTLPGFAPAVNVTGMNWSVFDSVGFLNSKQSSPPSQRTSMTLKGVYARTINCFVTFSPGWSVPRDSAAGLTVSDDMTRPSTLSGIVREVPSLVTSVS